MNSTTRTLTSIGLGAITSIGIFFFMSQLISHTSAPSKSDDNENFIDFVRIKRISTTEVKKRELPKKQEVEKEDTLKPKFAETKSESKPSKPNSPKFDTPTMDMAALASGPGGVGVSNYGVGGNAMGDGSAAGGNSSEMPIVRIEAQVPPEASLKGISDGWVKLYFDLNPDGTVTNPRVVSTSHPGVFEQAAIKAILKWRYRPKIVDGKPVIRKNIGIQLDFHLD